MNSEQALAVFEDYKIRRTYAEASEIWFFSVVDVVAALIQQPDYQAARNYWKVLKNRLTRVRQFRERKRLFLRKHMG